MARGSTGVLALLASLVVADSTHLVRFGYFREAQPAVGVACARGWFDIPSRGVEVVCLPQSSGGYAVSRLGAFCLVWIARRVCAGARDDVCLLRSAAPPPDNGDLDVSFLGSTPIATGVARGVDIESFFYGHGTGSSQGLVVDGRVIETPFDLVGKRIACPFGSTAHYQMAFIVDLLETLSGGVGLAEPLMNLAGDALIAAWEAGEIDGAFCWGTAYNLMRADANMKLLLTAEQIAGWEKPTFIPVVYRRGFLATDPAVVRHIAAVFAVLQSSWIDFDAAWSETGPTGLLASVTHFTQKNVSAANNMVSHVAISEFEFVSPYEQLSSCDYMGAAGCAATERGLAMDTKVGVI